MNVHPLERDRLNKDTKALVSEQEPDLIGYEEAAELLNVPVGTLYGWVARKRLPHIRLGPRFVKFSRARLRRWLADHEVQPEPATGRRD